MSVQREIKKKKAGCSMSRYEADILCITWRDIRRILCVLLDQIYSSETWHLTKYYEKVNELTKRNGEDTDIMN